MLRYILVFILFISMVSSCKCNKGNESTSSMTSDTMTTAQMNTTDGTVNAGNDTAMKGNAAGNNMSANAGTDANTQNNGKSLYRNGKSHARSTSGTPGYFPEGSDRLLADKDVEYLTAWGLAVMKNEIYARHGMTFPAGPMKDHFEEQTWYHGTSSNVRSKLSNTERTNLNFIENYKLKPDSETPSLNG